MTILEKISRKVKNLFEKLLESFGRTYGSTHFSHQLKHTSSHKKLFSNVKKLFDAHAPPQTHTATEHRHDSHLMELPGVEHPK